MNRKVKNIIKRDSDGWEDKILKLMQRALSGRSIKSKVFQSKSVQADLIKMRPEILRYSYPDKVLKDFPTQLPIYNLQERKNKKEKYGILVGELLFFCFCKKIDRTLDTSKKMLEKLDNCFTNVVTLVDILSHNIYDCRRVWKEHF